MSSERKKEKCIQECVRLVSQYEWRWIKHRICGNVNTSISAVVKNAILPAGQKEEGGISVAVQGKESPFGPTFETPTGKHTSCCPRLVWRKWKVGHFLPFPLLMSWVASLSSVPWPQLSAVKSTESGDTGRGFCTSYSRLRASVIKPATTKPSVRPSK